MVTKNQFSYLWDALETLPINIGNDFKALISAFRLFNNIKH